MLSRTSDQTSACVPVILSVPAIAAGARAVRVCGVLGRLALVVIIAWIGGRRTLDQLADAFQIRTPLAPAIRLDNVFFDQTPTAITRSLGWEHISVTVPAWRLRSDRTLWLRMGLEDWDSVPGDLRLAALDRLFDVYGDRLGGPPVWNRMTALDWDLVPPPVRVVAILRMIHARVAQMAGPGFDRRAKADLSDTIAAIVMVESWFDHRAVNINPRGDRDLGLAQASAWCRGSLARLYRQGLIDFTLADGEYFDPWVATRVATFWFLRMLTEADGDLGLAIRAYHRGISRARQGAGQEYLEAVISKRLRYIRNTGAPPTWRSVFERVRGEPADRVESSRDRMAADGCTGYPAPGWASSLAQADPGGL